MAFGTETRGETRSTAIHLQGLLLCLELSLVGLQKLSERTTGLIPMLIVVMETFTDRAPDSAFSQLSVPKSLRLDGALMEKILRFSATSAARG